MDAQTVKGVPALRLIIADVTWLTCFAGVWALLIVLWNTLWAVLLVPLFSLALAGMAEVVHQGVHGNLCGRTRLGNHALGAFASALFGIDFKSYRGFHFKHHRIVNTPEDPERAFYACPGYVSDARRWCELSAWKKLAALPGVIGSFSNTILTTLRSPSPLVHVLRWGIPLSIAAIGYFQGLGSWRALALEVVVAWYLPLGLFLFIDFFLTQSEHYGSESRTAERVTLAEQYGISWNLQLPAPVEFLVMGRNLHAEHHEYPGTHWSIARDQRTGRTLALGAYLRAWWTNGPRVTD